MYARVTISEVHPGKQDEAISISQGSILPAARQRKGYRGFLGMVDREANKGITITLWDTEADMMAGDEATPTFESRWQRLHPSWQSRSCGNTMRSPSAKSSDQRPQPARGKR